MSISLRTQNKAYENKIAAWEAKTEEAEEEQPKRKKITFDDNVSQPQNAPREAINIDECINWMVPVVPDSLDEEARRKEAEKRREEEEEKARAAEKEARKNTTDSSQMSLW